MIPSEINLICCRFIPLDVNALDLFLTLLSSHSHVMRRMAFIPFFGSFLRCSGSCGLGWGDGDMVDDGWWWIYATHPQHQQLIDYQIWSNKKKNKEGEAIMQSGVKGSDTGEFGDLKNPTKSIRH